MKLASTLAFLQMYEYMREKQKSLQVNITTGPGRIGHNDACPGQTNMAVCISART